MDFTFDQLNSSFQALPSLLTISAQNQPGFFSFGQVRRTVGTGGLALFDQGFVDEANPADFSVSLHITQLTPTTALASGPMTITDVDGDTFSAFIDGTFIRGDGRSTLIAQMTNMSFASDEGMYDGPDGGLFPTTFPVGVLSMGTLRLSLEDGPRSFDGDFSDAETGLVGWIPAPSSAATLALAGLVAVRRRR
jgi:hypothetical protein